MQVGRNGVCPGEVHPLPENRLSVAMLADAGKGEGSLAFAPSPSRQGEGVLHGSPIHVSRQARNAHLALWRSST